MNRRGFLKSGVAGAVSLGLAPLAGRTASAQPKTVRIGVIGVGGPGIPVTSARGLYLIRVLMKHPGVEISAICDINEVNLENALKTAEEISGKRPAGIGGDEFAYRNLLDRDDVDAVLIATPAGEHAHMAVDAMKAGKHVGSEVPAGYSMEELWELVRTKQQTGKRYMLLENYIYSKERMTLLNMVEQGALGEPYFAECGYLHDTRKLGFNPDGTLTWRGQSHVDKLGNSYATHALGPIAKCFGINEGDRLMHVTCAMSSPRMVPKFVKENFGPDTVAAQQKYQQGDFISTHVTTAKGRLIRIDRDSTSLRPAESFYVVQGTEGIFSTRQGICIDKEQHRWRPIAEYEEQYLHPYWRRDGELASSTGHGGGDFFVLRDFVEMAREDREPYVDVYDAATWSAIYPCTNESLRNNGAPSEVPDFTEGKWESAEWRNEHMRPA